MTSIETWELSPVKTKKYRVTLSNGQKIDFGSRFHGQYRDITPLKTYAHFDHNDEKRRNNYYKRHKINYPKYSADWLSKKYLW